MVHADTYSRPGWTIYTEFHTLTPDGAFYVGLTRRRTPLPATYYFEALAVEASLELAESGSRWVQPQNPIMYAHAFGSALLPGGGYGLFFTSWNAGISHVAVMPMSASGEISSPEQWFDFNAQPLAGGFTTRGDQRVVVVGAYDVPTAISLSVSPEGEVALVDVWSFAHDGVWVGQGVRLLPSGDRMVAGGRIATAAIEGSGEFAGSALAGPYGSIDAAHPGVSPDGRIAVTTWDFDGQGIHWGVFALTPDRGPVLLRDHVFNFGYTDIAFIPPRTEEMLGDANGDGLRDAADVVTYINHFADGPDIGGPLDSPGPGPTPTRTATSTPMTSPGSSISWWGARRRE
ncbi:MAG: hypothetical protein HUU25_07565 [Candidatus Sumerlaeia bacterium]|nr:hypothetical protein [Candidatus Sumerlaeia bacterium]